MIFHCRCYLKQNIILEKGEIIKPREVIPAKAGIQYINAGLRYFKKKVSDLFIGIKKTKKQKKVSDLFSAAA
ncbi:MAG: hypothetical protein ACYCTB_03970 [bacterium]